MGILGPEKGKFFKRRQRELKQLFAQNGRKSNKETFSGNGSVNKELFSTEGRITRSPYARNGGVTQNSSSHKAM
jgi:hypothetical protein